MKKKITLALFCLALQFASGQSTNNNKTEFFGIGINGGFTLGDYEDIYSNNVGFDVIYLRNITGKLYVGATTGFANYFGDTVTEQGVTTDYDDLQFIPLAASIRLNPFKNFYVGPDVGYAIGVNDGNDGGFYMSPRASYLLNDKFVFYVGYRLIALDDNLSSLQFGIGYNF